MIADYTNVAYTVTDTDWTVSDVPTEMNFAAIPSHRVKSENVKGSNALDSADQDRTDAPLYYGGEWT